MVSSPAGVEVGGGRLLAVMELQCCSSRPPSSRQLRRVGLPLPPRQANPAFRHWPPAAHVIPLILTISMAPMISRKQVIALACSQKVPIRLESNHSVQYVVNRGCTSTAMPDLKQGCVREGQWTDIDCLPKLMMLSSGTFDNSMNQSQKPRLAKSRWDQIEATSNNLLSIQCRLYNTNNATD